MVAVYRRNTNLPHPIDFPEIESANGAALPDIQIQEDGRLVWDALEECNTIDALLVQLIREKSPGGEERWRDVLREILDTLIKHGLVEFSLPGPFQKSSDVVTNKAAGELLVMTRDRPKVHVFNQSSALLWEALDSFNDSESLSNLALEAWPEKDPVETQRAIMVFIATLHDAGLIQQQDPCL